MKSLLEKIKPQYLEYIKSQEEKYPYVTADALGFLQSNTFITELKYKDVLYLMNIHYQVDGKYCSHPWEMFEDDKKVLEEKE